MNYFDKVGVFLFAGVAWYLLVKATGFKIIPERPKDTPGNRCDRCHEPLAVFNSIETPENQFVGDIHYMQIKEGQRFSVSVALKTARGHAAAIEPGTARFISSDESVVSVTPDPSSELKATVEGLDGSNNDSVVIEFRADGKVGEGVREVIATLDVTCTQGDATVVELVAGPVFDADDATAIEPPAETPADPAPVDPAGVPATDTTGPGTETPATDPVPTETSTEPAPATEGENNPSFPGPATPSVDPSEVETIPSTDPATEPLDTETPAAPSEDSGPPKPGDGSF